MNKPWQAQLAWNMTIKCDSTCTDLLHRPKHTVNTHKVSTSNTHTFLWILPNLTRFPPKMHNRKWMISSNHWLSLVCTMQQTFSSLEKWSNMGMINIKTVFAEMWTPAASGVMQLTDLWSRCSALGPSSVEGLLCPGAQVPSPSAVTADYGEAGVESERLYGRAAVKRRTERWEERGCRLQNKSTDWTALYSKHSTLLYVCVLIICLVPPLHIYSKSW